MAGYSGTSTSALNVAIGPQSLITQSALAYLPGETIQLTFTANPVTFMIGIITAYNAVTGAMTVNVLNVFGFAFSINPPFNTNPWGSTTEVLVGWTLSLLGGVQASTVAVVPTILVRNLGTNWDPQYGNGLQNYLTDIAAVAQIIGQRLKFLKNEWFENTSIGFPLFQQILGGASTSQAVALIIRQQILSVPYVFGISGFSITYAPIGRTYQFAASVQTAFGSITVSNSPASKN